MLIYCRIFFHKMSIAKLMLAIFFTCLLLSCDKKESVDLTPLSPVVTDSLTPQYGSPFANVPTREDAVIYEVNMRTFSNGGNFAGVTQRLDSLKVLGVNVIYLMPIYPLGILKGINSPYCVKDYKTINPEFGNLSDLRAIVDGAHSKNMSVILDWVGNHTSWDHTWIGAHKDWYLQNAAGDVVSPRVPGGMMLRN